MEIPATERYVSDVVISDLDKIATVYPLADDLFEDYNIIVTDALSIIYDYYTLSERELKSTLTHQIAN